MSVRALAALLTLVALGAGGAASYTVRPGDTLSAIALRLGVPLRTLAEANRLADPDRVMAGTTLRLPGSGPDAAVGRRVHVVRPGEHLTGIAARYGVSAGALAEANDLRDPDRLLAGRRLEVPVTGTAPLPVRAPRADIGTLLEDTARRYGWSPSFVKALAWQESGWNPRVRSRVGAVGVMQVLPDTGRFVSRSLVGRSLDLHDPADNIEAGVAFLDYLHGLTGGDPHAILAGYYQGLASVRRNGVYDDTRRYVANVLALRSRFR